MSQTTDEEVATPETPAEPIQQGITMVQTVGGQVFELNPKTTAAQVKMADGMDMETRIQTVERAASGAAVVKFADTIAARDALTGLRPGDIVIVTDATGDATVDKGGARYVKLPDGEASRFRKLSEDESMDIVCSWDHVEGRPASAVAQIDLAVAKQHSHDNYDTLTHLGDDGTNNLTYKGRRIDPGVVWVARVDSLDKIPTNLADGGLVILSGASGETGGDAGGKVAP